MSDSENIVRNTGYLFVGEVVTRLLSLFLVLVIASKLGEVGLGVYAFAFAFTDLFLNVIDLGIPVYMVKEIAKNKAKTGSYVSNVLGFRFVSLPLIIIVVLAITFFFINKTPETRIIIILAAVVMVFNFLSQPLKSVFFGNERHIYYSVLAILERLVPTVIGIGILFSGYGLIPVLGVFAASHFLSFLVHAYFVRTRFTKFTLSFNLKETLKITWASIPFWAASLFRMVYNRTDTIMLSFMHGFAATGLYNAAYKITEAFTFIPLIVITAVFPAMSRLHTKSKESLKMLYEKSFYYLLITALPLAVGLTLTADRIIGHLYGSEFAGAAVALKLLAWAQALLFLHFIMGFLLNSIDKQNQFTIATVIYAGFNVTLNFILIPKYSFAGAAAATIVTQIIAVGTLYYFASKNGYGLNLFRLSWKPITAVSVMGVLLLLLNTMNLFIVLPLALLSYAAVLIITKGIGKEEINLVKKVLKIS
jgi:O-antigen/teichoic acid export membrane protein